MQQKIKQFILDNLLYDDGRLKSRRIQWEQGRWIYNKDSSIYNFIIENSSFLDNPSFSQRLYHLYNEEMHSRVCEHCKINNVRFLSFNRGYNKYCSECNKSFYVRCNKDSIEKVSNTNKNKNKEALETFYNNFLTLNFKILETKEIIKFINEILSREDKKLIHYLFLKFKDEFLSILYLTKNIKPIEFKNSIKSFNFSERMFIIKENLLEIPKCKNCNNNRKFENIIVGYKQTCTSQKCWHESIVTLKNKKKLKKFNANGYLQIYDDVYYGKGSETNIKCSQCNLIFKNSFGNGITSKILCPICDKDKIIIRSQCEYEILEFLKENGIEEIEHNKRKTIAPFELDIFIPKLKLAIEYNGLYWHKDDKSRHIEKTKKCKEIGIELIQIFEDEWLCKKEIIKSIILNRIHKCKNIIYARKCIIKEIDTKIKNEFLDNNHIQGADSSKVKLGLFYNDELVSIMTFGKRSITGSKDIPMEMIRFCSKLEYSVVGGASKLFSHFINNFSYDKIISYADIRLFSGSLYEQLGFKLKHQSSPNYWYFKNNIQRIHRAKFQKHKLPKLLENFNIDLTEHENMKLHGWNMIWDCGNYVYEWNRPL